jgi:hypothetical protein
MAQVDRTQGRAYGAATASSDALRLPDGMDMRKITTPFLLHMLRNELRFPLLFFAEMQADGWRLPELEGERLCSKIEPMSASDPCYRTVIDTHVIPGLCTFLHEMPRKIDFENGDSVSQKCGLPQRAVLCFHHAKSPGGSRPCDSRMRESLITLAEEY